MIRLVPCTHTLRLFVIMYSIIHSLYRSVGSSFLPPLHPPPEVTSVDRRPNFPTKLTTDLFPPPQNPQNPRGPRIVRILLNRHRRNSPASRTPLQSTVVLVLCPQSIKVPQIGINPTGTLSRHGHSSTSPTRTRNTTTTTPCHCRLPQHGIQVEIQVHILLVLLLVGIGSTTSTTAAEATRRPHLHAPVLELVLLLLVWQVAQLFSACGGGGLLSQGTHRTANAAAAATAIAQFALQHRKVS